MKQEFRRRFCGCSPEILPIDADYLECQSPGLRKSSRHAVHYLAHGLEEGLDPTPFFLTEWYAWQNPDWPKDHAAPYLHYLDVGRNEGRYPSPLVDVTRYIEATAGAVPRERVYDAILAGLRSPSLGVYESPADLERCQRDFLAGISLLAHKVLQLRNPRPALVVCQAGRGALLEGWANADAREYYLFLNYYDAAGFRPGVGEYAAFQKGTKFSAMKLINDHFPWIFAGYEHVLFLDDDVLTNVEDLNAMFAACRHHRLDLAQMTLTEGSACNWPHLFSRPGSSGLRDVTAVEIMMPVFSRRALGWVAPTLGQSVSGFGLDLVWGHLVRGKGGRVAVLDQVSATHARAVDQSGGAYYRYLRRHGINAKAELWTLINRFGTPRDMVTR